MPVRATSQAVTSPADQRWRGGEGPACVGRTSPKAEADCSAGPRRLPGRLPQPSAPYTGAQQLRRRELKD